MGALTLVLVIACRCAPQALLAHGVWGARARPLGIGLLPQACMHARARSGLSSQHCRLRPPTKPRLRHTQGCNLALESVRVFAATLDASGSNLDVTPGAFTAARLNDVQAMQDIEYMQVRREMGGRHAPGRCYPTCCPTASAAWETGGSCFSPTLSVLTSCATLPPTPLPPPWLQILTSNAPGAQATAVQRATAKATMLGSVALSLAMHKLMPGVYRAPVYLLDGLRDARVP